MNNTRIQQLLKWAGLLSLLIGLLALLAMLIQGPGYKAGWWDLATSFRSVFPKVVIGGGLAILLGAIGLLGPKLTGGKPSLPGLVGILTGVSAAIVPISIQNTVKSVPMIHDITTNTVNPPEFIYVAPLRAKAANPISYDPDIAALQLEAYPDIKTIALAANPDDVFSAAVAVVTDLGWELVKADAIARRLEATETTAWFGFKDDVVIEIDQSGTTSTVDVRSKSRIGKSDLGVNAKRIREFRDTLLKEISIASKN